ncbi:MAG TPA: DNA polymerase III subunit gamma/tau [Acholeplasmataceae bacterium]|jgi:DNA polymerase-3 subunit gamma/tau|nr:DNA polymerase III subunit gamma/tau [Acholeplasmataceae bacterium]
MSYKALYRTYRPQKFSEVVGQEAIVRTLQNAIGSGKISHAYLFTGPRGTGKTTVARILAKALNCGNKQGAEPCGKCLVCQEIATSSSPDVVEIDAASNNGVDEIRDIREKVKFLPSGAKYKVYIIDEVHMLSTGAFNALLKTLEEPPKHVVFILATTEPHKVLPTIISRCQRFDFKALSVKKIAEMIKKVASQENIKITDEAVIAIAEGAEGGMRDALSYLDQAVSFTDDVITIDDVNSVTGNLNYNKMIELAYCFEEKNINAAIKAVNDLVIMGKEITKIVSGMIQFYRDILLYKNIDTTDFSRYIFEKEEFKRLAEVVEEEKIFYYVDSLSDIQARIRATAAPHIYLEVALIKMINGYAAGNVERKIAEIEKLLQNTGDESLEEWRDKIGGLEKRVTRIVEELNKLDLHNLAEKIKAIDTAAPASHSTVDFEKEIAALKEDIEEYISDRINDETKTRLNQIYEKINSIEARLQAPEAAPAVPKKPRSRVVEGQIVLFSDDEDQETAEETPVTPPSAEAQAEPEAEPKVTPAADPEEVSEPETKAEEEVRPQEAAEEVVNREHSRLVRTIRPEETPITDFSSMPSEQEEKPAAAEPEEAKPAEPYRNISLRNLANDPFSNYQVEVVERILHDSRTVEARKDRVRVLELWKNLQNNATSDQLDIADLLQEGQIVAVGNKEFIIVYPNSSLCNQVMKIKFKREALNLLYKNLGDTYNYIALPEKIWSEKRNEYINQYNIGIRFPKLTPIDDPSLDVRKENQEFLNRQEKLVDQAIKIFGEEFVKIR